MLPIFLKDQSQDAPQQGEKKNIERFLMKKSCEFHSHVYVSLKTWSVREHTWTLAVLNRYLLLLFSLHVNQVPVCLSRSKQSIRLCFFKPDLQQTLKCPHCVLASCSTEPPPQGGRLRLHSVLQTPWLMWCRSWDYFVSIQSSPNCFWTHRLRTLICVLV